MKPMLNTRTGLEVIEPDECRRLLAADDVGRLAIIDGGTPAVFPINYALDGDAIVFRTGPGTKLSAGPRRRSRSRSTASTGPGGRGGAWW